MKNYVKYNTKKPPSVIFWNNGQWAKGFRYYIKDGESWGSIAAKDNVSAQDLIKNNFKTLKPEYINWYILNFVGCDPQKSKDGYNMSFHTVNRQMYGYIITTNNLQPSRQAPIDIPVPPIASPVDPLNIPHDPRFFKYGPRLWFGIGAKVGGGAGKTGFDRVLMEFSSEWYDNQTGDYGVDRMIVSANTERSSWESLKTKGGTDFSGSYGFSGGLILGFITCCRHPFAIEGLTSDGPDFSFAVGLAGPVKSIAGGTRIAAKAASVGARFGKTAHALEEAEDTVSAFKLGFGTSYNYFSADEGKPNVYIFDTPAGLGLEIGVFWASTTYHLEFKHCTSEGDILPTKIEDPGDWF